MRFYQCAARTQGREAGPGLLQLVEGVEVVPSRSVRADVRDIHDGNLERPFRLAPSPSSDQKHAPVFDGQDVLQPTRGVGSEAEERTEARHVPVARERREESERTMVL